MIVAPPVTVFLSSGRVTPMDSFAATKARGSLWLCLLELKKRGESGFTSMMQYSNALRMQGVLDVALADNAQVADDS